MANVRTHAPRGRRGRNVLVAVGFLAGLGMSAFLFGGGYLRQRDAALTRAASATIEGPPCEALSRAEFEARGLKAPKATFYGDVVFARQFGHMSCDSLRYGAGWGTETYPVCQFTSPNALRVKTVRGEWFFLPGPGQPATVSTAEGRATCVLAAHFTMESLVNR